MAPKTIEVIDIGNSVHCDLCNEDYTNSDAKGGFLFESKAVCPKCEPDMMKSITLYNEEQYIKGYPKENETFREFCLRLRDGNNTITITTW